MQSRKLAKSKFFLGIAAGAMALSACSQQSEGNGQDASSVTVTEYPEQVYWGDLHLHTLYSFDSYNFGNKTLGPDDAYRFAQGEEVDAHGGKKAKLETPLDFLMVSDHAEFTGVFLGMDKGNPDIIDTPLGKAWAAMNEAGDTVSPMNQVVESITYGRGEGQPPRAFRKTVWSEIVEAAERHNKPGKFTTFAGYEWTSMPGGGNQHRVVVYKDNKDKTSQTIPFSAADSNNPMDLWRYLAAYEEKTGGEVMAIAHNGNISNGNMFGDVQIDGTAFTQEYVDLRARWDPISETTEVKGDGESHPLLSPEYEFADFEEWGFE